MGTFAAARHLSEGWAAWRRKAGNLAAAWNLAAAEHLAETEIEEADEHRCCGWAPLRRLNTLAAARNLAAAEHPSGRAPHGGWAEPFRLHEVGVADQILRKFVGPQGVGWSNTTVVTTKERKECGSWEGTSRYLCPCLLRRLTCGDKIHIK
jgi:hypothetical protein